MNTVLVVGATGATGRLLVEQLLNRGLRVKAVVRAAERLPEPLRTHERLTLIEASILDLSDGEMARHAAGCSAIASCLGHNLNLKGIYGRPRRLVTDAVRRLCEAVKANKTDAPVRFVLMNTAGNRNRDLHERQSFAEWCVMAHLRILLPPQADNEKAAEYLRTQVGQNDSQIEWVAVRPDSLIDADAVTGYQALPSPIRSPIFNAGKTSRINVAYFMAELIADDALWARWKGQMPVLYNKL